MKRETGRLRDLVFAASFLAAGAIAAAQTPESASSAVGGDARPKEFGFQDRITTVSATSFLPSNRYDNTFYYLSASFGRYVPFEISAPVYYYAAIDIPAGAIIDSIGINNLTTESGILTASLLQRDRYANVETLGSVSNTVHGWDTDYSDPLSILVADHVDQELVLEVEQAPNTDIFNYPYFSWVEVHWRRTLSPPPAAPTFNDVPADHPFFQFIEALKASGITGGCGNGADFCPDSPLTRGQMAVFLSKALGLHWPH